MNLRQTPTYVTCEVLPGLFDTEYYVLLSTSAYYIHRDNVRVREQPRAEHRVPGQVLGYVIATEPGKTLIQLPGEAVVGGLRTWVDNSALSAV
jgi:hypothetical protein